MLIAKSIFPGVNLTCIQTDKFKTGCLAIYLISGLHQKTASSSALLTQVLRRGSLNHPDMERIASALDDMYDARIEPVARKKGELHCIGFYADFPDERFIPGAKSVLERTASITGEMLLSPAMQDDFLRADYINSEKKNLIDEIRAAINDKHTYATERLIQEMCAGESFSVNRLGSENEALIITPQSLTAHYRQQISQPPVELMYCGSAEPERVEDALRAALQGLPERKDIKIPETEIIAYPPSGSPKTVVEKLDVQQGKLCAGFRLGESIKNDPDYPALMVFNAIYGSGVTSKLFLNIREKLALCYYASSIIDKHKGIMIVSSGIDSSNFETALDRTLAELENVKSGDISEWELLSAKSSVITSIKAALDRQSGLLELYFDSAVSAKPYDPEKLCDMVDAVTKERIVKTAGEINMDTVYFLTGEAGEDET